MYKIQVKELSSQCLPVFEKKEHICIGVSPFNSLFSEEYLVSLIEYCQSYFENFHLFIPDYPTVYTLLALGYDLPKAKKKTKKQVNWLRNKVIKSLLSTDISPSEVESHILDGKALKNNTFFQNELAEVSKKFDEDKDFKNSCLEASKWVLQNRLSDSEITEERLNIAVKYFLYELPLFAATPEIVGSSTSIFCYHQSIPFHDKLYANQLVYRPVAGQAYGVITY